MFLYLHLKISVLFLIKSVLCRSNTNQICVTHFLVSISIFIIFFHIAPAKRHPHFEDVQLILINLSKNEFIHNNDKPYNHGLPLSLPLLRII